MTAQKRLTSLWLYVATIVLLTVGTRVVLGPTPLLVGFYAAFVWVPLIVINAVAENRVIAAIREGHPQRWTEMSEAPEVNWDRPRASAFREFVRNDNAYGDARLRDSLDFRRGVTPIMFTAFGLFLFMPFLVS